MSAFRKLVGQPADGWTQSQYVARVGMLEGIAEAAADCRERQREYFRSRTSHDLEHAKRAEKRLDHLLDQLAKPPETPLFGADS